MLSGKPLFVAKTVILEFDWVCRYVYEADKKDVSDMLAHLIGLAAVSVEDVGSVEKALEWNRHGLDFADALHLAPSASAQQFVTFDSKFSGRAKRLKTHPAVKSPATP
jgi:predicted nucleic-acid-binding protein